MDKKVSIESKPKSRRKRRTIFWIVGGLLIILIAAGTATLLIIQKQNAANQDTGISYDQYTITKGDIADTIEESGSLIFADEQLVTSDYELVADKVYLKAGDRVAEDDIIATIDTKALAESLSAAREALATIDSQLSSSDESIGDTYVSSAVEGRVKALHIAEGENVQNSMLTYGSLFVISTDGTLKVVFTPVAGSSVTPGQSVNVKITTDAGTEDTTGWVSKKCDDGTCVVTIDDDTYATGADAIISDESGNILGQDRLQVSAPYPVTLSSGTVESLAVEENDYVYEGSTLFYLENGQQSEAFLDLLVSRADAWNTVAALSALQSTPSITASSSGILTSISLVSGGSVMAGSELYRIAPENGFVMSISVDEDDISSIVIGQDAAITIDSLDDLAVNGKVTSISHIGSVSNGVTTYTVSVQLDDTQGLLSGMSADCTITIESATDAILVPIGAIQTVQDKKYVLLSDGSTSGTLTEIQLGLVTDTFAQAVSGLNEGDTILVATYDSTEENTSMIGIPGGMTGAMTGGGPMGGDMPQGGGQAGMQPNGQNG